jgi:uncharacterized Tic20 family protein
VVVLPLFPAVVILAIVLLNLLVGYSSIFDNATRVTAPGTSEITLTQSGTYTIGYEHTAGGTAAGGADASGQPDLQNPQIRARVSSMRLAVVSTASKVSVHINHLEPGTFSSSAGTREDDAIAQFSVDRPGKYSLVSRYQDGQPGPRVVLAMAAGSPSSHGIETVVIFGAVGLLFVSSMLGIGTILSRMPPRGRFRVAGSQPPGPGYELSTDDQRVWSQLSHLSALLATIVAPLVIMHALGNASPYVRKHAVEALNFQITFVVAEIALVILSNIFSIPGQSGFALFAAVILLGLALTLSGALIVLPIRAAVGSHRGKLYRYPLTARFVK